MARQISIGPANLQFLGAQTDMRKIYSVMDLLLSSSVSEGFGLAIVEAAACGVPVLARYCGGVTDDLIVECELAVAQDTRTLTQRALEVMHSPDSRGKLANQCWLWSRKYIGSQNSLDKYRDLLEALS
jgi:glycosyltransferase involved in cell wall biosynthesis